MKTTVTIEEDLTAQLARAALTSGRDVNQLVNDLVRQAMQERPAEEVVVPKPFKQVTHKLGWHPGMTWDRIQEMLLAEESAQYQTGPTAR